ncbi:hypothetical protein BH11MYX3_BH11MYX3_01080 [soil metagenome]
MMAMSLRLVLVLAVAPVLAATSAHAQAPGGYAQPPGDYAGDDYAGPSAMQPQVVVAPAPAVFEPRWSVALSVGSLSLSPENNPDNASTDFAIGQLALRYRGWRHVELELSLAGGNEQLPDGAGEGDLKVAHVTFAARYRFNARQHTNWWILAGLGATTVAPKDASSDQAKMAQRPHGLLGIGMEYRWTHFAMQAELKAIAVGPTEDEQKIADDRGMDPQGITGGSFTLGGAYYF